MLWSYMNIQLCAKVRTVLVHALVFLCFVCALHTGLRWAGLRYLILWKNLNIKFVFIYLFFTPIICLLINAFNFLNSKIVN